LSWLRPRVTTSCNNEPSKQRQEIQKESSKAFDQQREAVKYPVAELRDSLERRNIRRRLLLTNDPNAVGYVYYTPFGKILGYWTLEGKVSSVKSQMNPSDELTNDLSDCSGCFESQVLQSAGDDGAFGENQDAVFFFTTEGVMIEVPEDDYFYSTQPVTIGGLLELNQ
jgi:hypothetical protein